MADGIHAVMDAVQLAPANAPLDRRRGEPEREELPSRDDALLLGGEDGEAESGGGAGKCRLSTLSSTTPWRRGGMRASVAAGV